MVGQRFLCGGRTFWCVDTHADGSVTLCSGGVEFSVSEKMLATSYVYLGRVREGNNYVAGVGSSDVVRGNTYTVSKVGEDGTVTLSSGLSMPLCTFMKVF